jgi:hypothetical protein
MMRRSYGERKRMIAFGYKWQARGAVSMRCAACKAVVPCRAILAHIQEAHAHSRLGRMLRQLQTQGWVDLGPPRGGTTDGAAPP